MMTADGGVSVPVKNNTNLDLDIKMDRECLMFHFRGKKYSCDFRIEDLQEGEDIEVMLSGYCLRARCAGQSLEFVENTTTTPAPEQPPLPGADVCFPGRPVDWRNPKTTSSADNPNHPSRNRLVARPSSPPLPVSKRSVSMQNTTGINLDLLVDAASNSIRLEHDGRTYTCMLPKKSDVSSAKVYVSNFEFKARVGTRTLSFTPDEPKPQNPRKKLRVGLEASHQILSTESSRRSPVQGESFEVKNLTAMPISPQVDTQEKKLAFEHLETKYECDLSPLWECLVGNTLFVYVANFKFFARVAGKKLPIKKVDCEKGDIEWGSMLLAHTGLPTVHHNLVDHPMRCKNKTGLDWQEIQSSCIGGWIRLEGKDGNTYICTKMELTDGQVKATEQAPEALIFMANFQIFARVNGKTYQFKHTAGGSDTLKSSTKPGLPVTHQLLRPTPESRKLNIRDATGMGSNSYTEYCEETNRIIFTYNGEEYSCSGSRFCAASESNVVVYMANFRVFARAGSVKEELMKSSDPNRLIHVAPCTRLGLHACQSVLMDKPFTVINNTGAELPCVHSSMREGYLRVEASDGTVYECRDLPKHGDAGTVFLYFSNGRIHARLVDQKYELDVVNGMDAGSSAAAAEKRLGIHASHALLTLDQGASGPDMIKTVLMT